MQKIDRPDNSFVLKESLCTGCLNCQLICSITYANEFNPNMAYVNINREKGQTTSIKFKDDCIICGLCAEHCIYGALISKKEN